MNLVAHVDLSFNNSDWVVGNLLADSVRGNDKYQYSTDILNGIDIHRFIDFFTDHHVAVKKCVEIIKAEHGRYAPVIVDVIFDYMLVTNCERNSEKSLDTFAAESYQIINQRKKEFPPSLYKLMTSLVNEDWIHQFGSIAYLGKTMERMDKRTKFPSNFVGAIQTLETNIDVFNELFNIFYPELKQSVLDYIYGRWKLIS